MRRVLSAAARAAIPPLRRAILTRNVVVIPDVLEDPEYAMRDNATLAAGFRSVLAVPLLRDGERNRRHRRRPARTRAVSRTTRSRCSRPSPTRRSSPSRTCACSRSWEPQSRPHRGAGAADGDQRDPARDQPVADGRAAGLRYDRGGRTASCAVPVSANVFTLDGELIHMAAFANVTSGSSRCPAPILSRDRSAATRRPAGRS